MVENNVILKRKHEIKIEPLANFVDAAIAKYGTESKFEEAEKVVNVLLQLLKKKRLVRELGYSELNDTLIAAAYLHNLFYDYTVENVNGDLGNWTRLFEARYTLSKMEESKNVSDQILYAIFQSIEGQLADDMPVPYCRVDIGSPAVFLGNAVFMVKELKEVEI